MRRKPTQPINLELYIGELILPDLDSRQCGQVTGAIEQALNALIAEYGIPSHLNSSPLHIDSTAIEITTGSSAQTIAAQIAQSIYTQMDSPATSQSSRLFPTRTNSKSAK